MPDEAPNNAPEQESDIGLDEAYTLNMKRTVEEFLHESLTDIRDLRAYRDKVLSDAHGHDNTQREISTQALQNAVETANMVGKQTIRHADIAIDRQWNVDEQGYTVNEILRNQTFKDAIAAAVAAAVNEVLAAQK